MFVGRNFGAVYGVIFAGNCLGSATGPLLAGLVFDFTGSYMVAFAAAGLSVLVATFLVWLAAPRKVRRVVVS